MKSKVNILVLTGDGINCEVETAAAFKSERSMVQIQHVHDLLLSPESLSHYHILVLPGGFSFGDEIGSGQILALKLKYGLGEQLKKFVEAKKLILGICNGFQVLVRLGLLPKPFAEREMTLTHNRQGHFINQWVNLRVPTSKCIWTKKLQDQNNNQTVQFPMRHGEGRIVFSGNSQKQKKIFENLKENQQIAFYYEQDVNGSYEKIAGVTDPSGCILGLMPHPEAAMSKWLSPDARDKSASKDSGALIFEAALEHCEQQFFNQDLKL